MLLSVDGIVNSISQFNYNPDANVTFDTWYQRYEDLFTVDFASQDDAWKVRVLLRKLGPAEYERSSPHNTLLGRCECCYVNWVPQNMNGTET
ncbi:unnamed protein product [Trichobilharzia regenti]|nr:unnamed protein product [Trichobilharzia regenti]